MQVNGSTALVTGASKRIGRAIALSLAENGCNVAVHYFNSHEEAVQTCETIRGLGVKSQPVQADLTKSKIAQDYGLKQSMRSMRSQTS